jgi:hypothetical protein
MQAVEGARAPSAPLAASVPGCVCWPQSIPWIVEAGTMFRILKSILGIYEYTRLAAAVVIAR